ncbi:MAG: adenylyltransferase/cytidyltransferase family protein [Planctomycetota bacterium]
MPILHSFPQKDIGFTSGTFDLLHLGHLSYLQQTKEYCKILVVGVNSDLSVKAYKSPLRPIVPEQERLALIAGLECVDYVFLFSETNNHHNIKELKPGWYFKAGDYQLSQLSSKNLLESYGGTIKILSEIPHLSSTAMIQKIQGLPSSS